MYGYNIIFMSVITIYLHVRMTYVRRGEVFAARRLCGTTTHEAVYRKAKVSSGDQKILL